MCAKKKSSRLVLSRLILASKFSPPGRGGGWLEGQGAHALGGRQMRVVSTGVLSCRQALHATHTVLTWQPY